MIIGDGDLASVLEDRMGYTFFASGVSNSGEQREEEYRREISLLLSQNVYSHLVYFSSLGIFSGASRYLQHKIAMEELVERQFKSFTIVRIGNITWGKNPHTIINFLKKKIEKNKPFEVRDEYKYLVNKEEFLYWMDLIPSWNCEMNITGRRVSVKQIVKEIKLGKL